MGCGKDGGLPASARVWGRVAASDGLRVRIGGLGRLARLGDGVAIAASGGREVPAEIVALDGATATAMLMAAGEGIAADARAYLEPTALPRPCDGWIGRVIDAFGRSHDGAPLPEGDRPAPLRRAPPGAAERRGLGRRLETGMATLDSVLPFCRGQRLGLFAGSGVGKSTMLGQLARGMEADVVVAALVGERGREVGGFVRDLLDPAGRARTVTVAATSDEPAPVRRRAALLAVATAEHFRDEGRQVLLLFDSVTRFAEAHRETALASGEPPALRAFPPSTASEIAALCERAGPGTGTAGDITAVFTVLVSGSDLEEPVADMLRGVLDGHVVLDRSIAERGRFPAVDVVRSVSRAAPGCWSSGEAALAGELRELVALAEEARPMLRAGLYVPGGDARLDRAVALSRRIEDFLSEFDPCPSHGWAFARLAAALGG